MLIRTRTYVQGILILAALGISPILSAAAGPAANTTDAVAQATPVAPVELGLIGVTEGVFPKVIRAAKYTPITLWVVNGTKDPKTLSLQVPKPIELEAKANEIMQVKIDSLPVGKYVIAFKGKKDPTPLEAVLEIGAAPQTGAQEIALMTGRKQFKPEISRVRADLPLTIFMYTTVGIPHGDIGILGTPINFKLKNKTMETVELKTGLAVGEHPISRPGYPQQKHGITSRIVAE
jgi:hypothetical protein